MAHSAKAEGERETPWIYACATCYSDYDFILAAEQSIPRNEAGYLIVFNENTRQMKTLFGYKLHDRELRMDDVYAEIVTTLPEHNLSFLEHLSWIDQGKPQITVSVIYPEREAIRYQADMGEIYADRAWGLAVEQKKVSIFDKNKPLIIALKFSNGDVVYVYAVPMTRVAQIILVTDKNGKVISGGSGGSGGGGGAGGVLGGGAGPWHIPTDDGGLTCTLDEKTLVCSKQSPK